MPADHAMAMDVSSFKPQWSLTVDRSTPAARRVFSMALVIAGHVAVGIIAFYQGVVVPQQVDIPLTVTMVENPAPDLPLPEPPAPTLAPDMMKPPPVQVAMPIIPLAVEAPPRPNAITVATAPPAPKQNATSDAGPTPVTTAVSPPSQGTPPADYMSRLLAHLNQAKRYPMAARRLRHQGVVMVRFTMDRGGHVVAARLEQQSNYKLLNDEAMELLARAQPLPPLPEDMPDRIELVVPIDFSLKAA